MERFQRRRVMMIGTACRIDRSRGRFAGPRIDIPDAGLSLPEVVGQATNLHAEAGAAAPGKRCLISQTVP